MRAGIPAGRLRLRRRPWPRRGPGPRRRPWLSRRARRVAHFSAGPRHPLGIAAFVSIPANLGYLALALLVGLESSGVPLPGETALIASGVLASRGDLSIELVILIAAAAAIVGDNVGYWIGRKGGRKLLTAKGPLL